MVCIFSACCSVAWIKQSWDWLAKVWRNIPFTDSLPLPGFPVLFRATGCILEEVSLLVATHPLQLQYEDDLVTNTFTEVPKPWKMAVHKGIWDPKPRVTNIEGTNLKSLIHRLCKGGMDQCAIDMVFPLRSFGTYPPVHIKVQAHLQCVARRFLPYAKGAKEAGVMTRLFRGPQAPSSVIRSCSQMQTA